MPSNEAPTWYERADGVASSRTDEFFKRLDLDEVESYTGSTESPIGFVQLILVTRDMISEYVSTCGDPWMSERRNFEPGWYVTRQDDNGLIWAMSYGIDGVYNEERARADYESAENAHTYWLGDQHEELYGEGSEDN